jgi:hypothetical protein
MRQLAIRVLQACCFLLASCGSSDTAAPSAPIATVSTSTATSAQRFSPSPVALPNIPTRQFVVTAYGAIPDDAKDDTTAIQAGIDAVGAAGGGTLVFPPGRYDISINSATRRALTLVPKLRMLASPAGQATVRLADNQIVYESIMATASYPTRLDDAEFIGMTFDANGLNNPVRDPNETNGDAPMQKANPTLRYFIRSFAGNRVRVADCTFTNSDNGNTLSFNGVDAGDITIERSRFINAGGALIDHDHSSVYTFARRVIIANNEFKSRNGAGTIGARTAFETHDDDVEVRDNLIDGFLQGTNIVGRASSPSRQLYRNNRFINVAVGINIWPLNDVLLSAGVPAFADLTIANNTITLNTDAWRASAAFVINQPGGIHFETDVADGRLARLDILDNRITFDTFTGKSPGSDRFSAGIELRGVDGKLAITTLNASRNTIVNSIGPGILSAAMVGGSEPSVMSGNIFVNPGRGLNLRGEGDPLRTGIVVGGMPNNLSLTGNNVLTSTTPASTLFGIVLAANCVGNCAVTTNTASGLQQALLVNGTGWTTP